MTEELNRWVLDRRMIDGTPRGLTLVGGVLMVISAALPWFTAGAIATDPFSGRALIALLLGLTVVVTTFLLDRSTAPWQVASAAATTVGLLLVVVSILAPPRALGPSAGVALCLVGAVTIGLGLFAARWRRGSLPAASVDDGREASPPRPTRRRIVVVSIVGVAAVGLAYLVLWPAPTPDLESQANPTTTYDEAVERFEQLAADEGDDVWGPCRSTLLDHGETTEAVVVLFHGLTNCPEQFLELGTELHDAGANVVIMRAPEHGLTNSDGTGIGGVDKVASLTSSDLRQYADGAIDVATGLGDEVRVLGLSMGGVIAGWTAQERGDVDRVVAVAPAISIPRVPAVLTHLFRNVFHKLPNVSLPSGGADIDHTYAGGTTKGLDATFGMAAYLADSAYEEPPAANEVIVVLNPTDEQVDPTHLSEFTDAWAGSGGDVRLHRLPRAGLRHDVIDLDQPDAQPELVYPILTSLLDGDRP